MSKRKSGVVCLIFGAILLPAGSWVACAIGLPTIEAAKASVNWPKVEGTITESDMKTRQEMKNNEQRDMYEALIEFAYKVGEKEYKSRNVEFGGGGESSSRSSIKEVVDRYPMGKKVDVFYNPEKPDEAVLVPGVSLTSYTPVGAGVLIAITGLVLLWFGQRLFREAWRDEDAAAGFDPTAK